MMVTEMVFNDFFHPDNNSLVILKPEPLMRIELTTSSLPRKCSTTELQRLVKMEVCSFRLHNHPIGMFYFQLLYERKTGLEPATYSLEGYRSTK